MIDRHRIATLAFAALFALATAPALASGTLVPAIDLSRDAAQARANHEVMLLMFSLPGCAPCKRIEESYLLPLQRDAHYSNRVLIRKIEDFSGDKSVKDFRGRVLPERDLAARYNVRFAPTVVFVDPTGSSIARPLVGDDVAGFYGGYLDSALAASLRVVEKE